LTRLKVIADGRCEAVQNVYQIVYDVEVLKASSPTPKESMFKKGKISKVKKRASHVSTSMLHITE